MSTPRDLPRDELMKLADETIADYANKGITADVYFKFWCAHCGHRCMLADKNMLWERGICDVCGKESKIDRGGFMVHAVIGK